MALVTVTGLDICVVLWNLFYFHVPPPADLEAWSRDGIVSWLHTIFWAPHHLVSMTCCMLAFLLAWIHEKETNRGRDCHSNTHCACAFERVRALDLRHICVLPCGDPLGNLEGCHRTHMASCIRFGFRGRGIGRSAPPLSTRLVARAIQPASSVYGRQPLPLFICRSADDPPGWIVGLENLSIDWLRSIHPRPRILPGCFFCCPDISLELGFFFAVFLIFLIPAWRKRTPLTEAQRSLVFLAAATAPVMSFIRSGVLQTNDFGWRAALFVQFPMLLLGSDLIMSWRVADKARNAPTETAGLPGTTPHWLRSVASFALVIGVLSTVCQALMFRFLIPIGDRTAPPGHRTGSSQPLAKGLYLRRRVCGNERSHSARCCGAVQPRGPGSGPNVDDREYARDRSPDGNRKRRGQLWRRFGG
jgi:hypothetical protein